MHTSSIIMYLSWPVVIVIAFFAIRFALKLYEKNQAKLRQEPDPEFAPDKTK